MEDKSTSTDEKPTKNYKDKLYVREYMRNYMNDKYSVAVTCETCGKHVTKYSMSEHATSKDGYIHKLESLLLNV